jgi:iron complex outermembrane receptor protein
VLAGGLLRLCVFNASSRLFRCGLLTCWVLLAAGSFAAIAPGERIRFSIPSQSLTSALGEFARQSELHLLYSSALTEGKSTRPLFGYFTVEEALTRLLDEANLEFVVGERTIAIRRARNKVVADRAPSLEEITEESALAELPVLDAAIAEVIVQARRRDENLQQVPVAVTAMDAQDIEVRSIQSAEDLNGRVPGVAVNGGNFFGRSTGAFRIRGIPGVAVYVDGVVRGAADGLLMNLVEIERVEVMRGPQGTTFGKNAVGGAVQYVTQQPREALGARVKATVGTASRADVVANMDLPLREHLLSKISLASFNRGGYVEAPTGDELGDQRDSVVRAELLWRPTDRMEARVIGEFAEQRSNSTPATVWSLNPVCPNDPLPDVFVGSVPNSLCIYEAVGAHIRPAWLHGHREEWRTEASEGLGNTYRSLGAVVQWDWRMSDRLQWKVLAGQRQIEAFRDHDFDGTPYAIYQSFAGSEVEESNFEGQLLFSGARLSGVTGFYLYADDSWGSRQNWVANELRFEPYLTARRDLGGGYAAFDPSIIHILTRNRSEGWAVFSEWSYRLVQGLSISVGARFNHDRIASAAYRPIGILPERCCARTRSLRPPAGVAPLSGSATFEEIAPRVSLQYQWAPGFMSYYTYSKGFGAGGFTGGGVPNLPNGGFMAYGPETLTNHEIGVRTDWLDHRLRLNAAAFFGEYDDVQITEESQGAPGFPLMTNAGEGEIWGLEAEGIFSPNRNLTFNVSASWLRARYTEVGRAQNLRTDSPFAYAPRLAYAVGAQYDWIWPVHGTLSARLDYIWQDDVYSTSDVNTQTLQRAYGVANGRLGFRARSGKWELALVGTNLLNQFYRLNGFFLPADQIETGTPARPREWALTFQYAIN